MHGRWKTHRGSIDMHNELTNEEDESAGDGKTKISQDPEECDILYTFGQEEQSKTHDQIIALPALSTENTNLHDQNEMNIDIDCKISNSNMVSNGERSHYIKPYQSQFKPNVDSPLSCLAKSVDSRSSTLDIQSNLENNHSKVKISTVSSKDIDKKLSLGPAEGEVMSEGETCSVYYREATMTSTVQLDFEKKQDRNVDFLKSFWRPEPYVKKFEKQSDRPNVKLKPSTHTTHGKTEKKPRKTKHFGNKILRKLGATFFKSENRKCYPPDMSDEEIDSEDDENVITNDLYQSGFSSDDSGGDDYDKNNKGGYFMNPGSGLNSYCQSDTTSPSSSRLNSSSGRNTGCFDRSSFGTFQSYSEIKIIEQENRESDMLFKSVPHDEDHSRTNEANNTQIHCDIPLKGTRQQSGKYNMISNWSHIESGQKYPNVKSVDNDQLRKNNDVDDTKNSITSHTVNNDDINTTEKPNIFWNPLSKTVQQNGKNTKGSISQDSSNQLMSVPYFQQSECNSARQSERSSLELYDQFSSNTGSSESVPMPSESMNAPNELNTKSSKSFKVNPPSKPQRIMDELSISEDQFEREKGYNDRDDIDHLLNDHDLGETELSDYSLHSNDPRVTNDLYQPNHPIIHAQYNSDLYTENNSEIPDDQFSQHKMNSRATKVRGKVACNECGKRRVIYAASKLTTPEHRLILRVEEELLYVCGSPLFPGGTLYQDKIIVREALSCSAPIETTYYSDQHDNHCHCHHHMIHDNNQICSGQHHHCHHHHQHHHDLEIADTIITSAVTDEYDEMTFKEDVSHISELDARNRFSTVSCTATSDVGTSSDTFSEQYRKQYEAFEKINNFAKIGEKKILFSDKETFATRNWEDTEETRKQITDYWSRDKSYPSFKYNNEERKNDLDPSCKFEKELINNKSINDKYAGCRYTRIQDTKLKGSKISYNRRISNTENTGNGNSCNNGTLVTDCRLKSSCTLNGNVGVANETIKTKGTFSDVKGVMNCKARIENVWNDNPGYGSNLNCANNQPYQTSSTGETNIRYGSDDLSPSSSETKSRFTDDNTVTCNNKPNPAREKGTSNVFTDTLIKLLSELGNDGITSPHPASPTTTYIPPSMTGCMPACGCGNCKNCQSHRTFTLMKTLAKSIGREIHDVIPDGNCMFRSIIDQLRMQGELTMTSNQLRQKAVTYLRQNPYHEDGTHLEAFLSADTYTWDQYLHRMGKDGEWGDNIILRGLVEVIGRRISIISAFGSIYNQTLVSPYHCEFDQSNDVVLGHMDDQHYVSLRKDDWKDTWYLYAQQKNLKDENGIHMTYDPEEIFNHLMTVSDLTAVDSFSGIPHLHLSYVVKRVLPRLHIKGVPKTVVNALERRMTKQSQSSTRFEYYGSAVEGLAAYIVDLSQLKQQIVSKETDSKTTKVPSPSYATRMSYTAVPSIDQRKKDSLKLLEMHFKDVHPGFLRLYCPAAMPSEMKHYKLFKFINGIPYLISNEDNRYSRDSADCIYIACTEWPASCISSWLDRNRPSGWPSGKVVEDALSEPLMIFPRSHPQSEDSEVEWQLCFAKSEKILAESLNKFQKYCFHVFQLLLAYNIDEGQHFKRYYLKNIFFYALEQIQEEQWQSHVGICLLHLLDQTVMALKTRNLPHYFIPENNLIDHIDNQTCHEIMLKVKAIRQFPIISFIMLAEGHHLTTSWFADAVIEDVPTFRKHLNIEDSARQVFLPNYITDIQQDIHLKRYRKAVNIFMEAFHNITEIWFIDMTLVRLLTTLFSNIPSSSQWWFCFFLDFFRKKDSLHHVFHHEKGILFTKLLDNPEDSGPFWAVKIPHSLLREISLCQQYGGPIGFLEVLCSELISQEVGPEAAFYLRILIMKLHCQMLEQISKDRSNEKDSIDAPTEQKDKAEDARIRSLSARIKSDKKYTDYLTTTIFVTRLYTAYINLYHCYDHLMGQPELFTEHAQDFEAICDGVATRDAYRKIADIWWTLGSVDKYHEYMDKYDNASS